MVYSALGDSRFGMTHDDHGFKYFTFSDFFYDRSGNGTLIVSSPYSELIDIVHRWIDDQQAVFLGSHEFKVQRVKMFKPELKNYFISGSPIILYLDSTSGEYFSLRKHGDIPFFLDRLKDNALKKYEFFSGTKIDLEEPLFDAVEFRREVAVPVRIRGNELIFIGSLWDSFEKDDFSEYKDFYYFLMETGLGEKNSLGFGFLNPVRSNAS